MAKFKMAAKVYKINIFTNNFATKYARDINNMCILVFSGLFLEKILYIYANMSKNNWILQ